MADSIDGFKPPAPPPSAPSRSVPSQQVQAGFSGFDGGSYFERGAKPAADRGRSLLHPPATTGPQASPAEVLARTLELFRTLAGQ